MEACVAVSAECTVSFICRQCSLWSWAFRRDVYRIENSDWNWCRLLWPRISHVRRAVFVLVRPHTRRREKLSRTKVRFESTGSDKNCRQSSINPHYRDRSEFNVVKTKKNTRWAGSAFDGKSWYSSETVCGQNKLGWSSHHCRSDPLGHKTDFHCTFSLRLVANLCIKISNNNNKTRLTHS